MISPTCDHTNQLSGFLGHWFVSSLLWWRPLHGLRRCTSGARARLSEFSQQRLRFLQIARTEPLRKPPINRSQQFARLLHLALDAPEAGEAPARVRVCDRC